MARPDIVLEGESGTVVVHLKMQGSAGAPTSHDERLAELLATVARLNELWTGMAHVHADLAPPNLRISGASARRSTTSDLGPAAETRADDVRASLAELLVPRLDELDPVPHAAIEQAKRRARLRTNLLASGAYTYAALADGRQSSPSAVRQWVHRARRRGALFTVAHDNETLVPAFLLDEDLEPRPEYAGAIRALTAVGEDSWALWAWFASPSGWLDGMVPAEHALIDEAGVTRAAQRRATNAA